MSNILDALLKCAETGNHHLFDQLSQNLDINSQFSDKDGELPVNYTLLEKAVFDDNLKVIPFLLSKGADVNLINANGLSPLLYALNFELIEIADLLIAYGADVNLKIDGNPILHYALKEGYIDGINLLLDRGVDTNVVFKIQTVNPEYPHIFPALSFAALSLIAGSKNNHHQTFKRLVTLCDDVNAVGSSGPPALGIAAIDSYEGMVDLLDAGAERTYLDPGSGEKVTIQTELLEAYDRSEKITSSIPGLSKSPSKRAKPL